MQTSLMKTHLWLTLVLQSMAHALNQWPINGFSHSQNGWSKKWRVEVGVVPLTVKLTITFEKDFTSFPATLSFVGFEVKGEMLHQETQWSHWIESWTDDVVIGAPYDWGKQARRDYIYQVDWDDWSWMSRVRGVLLCNDGEKENLKNLLDTSWYCF